MTSIKDINYDEIELLLKNNKIIIPKNKDDAYATALKFITTHDDYNAPDQIYFWIIAHNALQSKLDIPKYSSREFYSLSKKQKTDLANLLGLEAKDDYDIINVLYYMDKIESKEIYPLIDFKIVAKVYGKPFATGLKDNGFIRIIDIDKYLEKFDNYPDKTSIFYDGSGGSYDYKDRKGRTVHVHHGTLAGLGRLKMHFGDEYYLAKYGKELKHEEIDNDTFSEYMVTM